MQVEHKVTLKGGGASFKIKSNLSIPHGQAALIFAKDAQKIEEAVGSNRANDEQLHRHNAYVIGCVMSSVAFLESLINEFFVDVKDSTRAKYLKNLKQDRCERIAQLSEIEGVDRFNVLEKYQIVLGALDADKLSKGSNPFQDANLLIKLRNALVHYKPKWLPAGEELDEEKYMKKYLSGKFAINPLVGDRNTFWPYKCLSAGCAKWAVESSVSFTDNFFQIIGLAPPYDMSREFIAFK